jgi:hypothetical protein
MGGSKGMPQYCKIETISEAAGNREGDSARLGAFLRYEWTSGELSATGGVANDGLLDGLTHAKALNGSTPFATLTWLSRF